MKVHIISAAEDVAKSFKSGKEYTLETHGESDFSKIDSLSGLVYLDFRLLTQTRWASQINKISENKNIRLGLIDSDGSVPDPGHVFHRGGVDYISAEVLAKGVTAKRYDAVLQFSPLDVADLPVSNEGVPLSGSDWSKIKKGERYLFGLLFIELDHIRKIKNQLGPERSEIYAQEFKDFFTDFFSFWDGYPWIQNDFGGVVLFPFDGKKLFPLEASLEILLNSDFVKFSQFDYQTSFRQVVHLAPTTYIEKGKTSHLVCDTINTIFHLGQKWAEPGSLVLTDEAYAFLPESLKPFFPEKGMFEDRMTYRLKDRG